MILEQYLQEIGLTKKAAKLYIAGLELGPTNMQQLAKTSKIKRSTIYEILEDLLEQGLFFVTKKGKRSLYIAVEPDNLMLALKSKQKVLSQILPDLEALKNTNATKPTTRIFEGVQGVKQIYNDMIKKSGKILAFAAPKENIAKTLLDFLQKEWEPQRIRRKIEMQRININNTDNKNYTYKIKKIPDELEEIYYLPKENYPFSIGIYVYRKKVALISYGKKEMFGLVLRSPEINLTLKTLFHFMWNKEFVDKYAP